MRRQPRMAGLLLLAWGAVVCASGCASMRERNPLPKWFGSTAEDSERLVTLARLEERQGKHQQAEEILRRVLEVDPQHSEAHQRLGVIALREGRVDAGLAELELARQSLKKPNSELLADLGYGYYLKNDSQTAELFLRESLQIDPRNKRAHNNLGIILGERGEFEPALAEFRQSGTEAEALANLAYIQARFGELTEAEKNYHAALASDGSLRSAAEALIQITELRAKAEGRPLPPDLPKVAVPYTPAVLPASFQAPPAAQTSAGQPLLPTGKANEPSRVMTPAPITPPNSTATPLPGQPSRIATIPATSPASSAMPNGGSMASPAAGAPSATSAWATPRALHAAPTVGTSSRVDYR